MKLYQIVFFLFAVLSCEAQAVFFVKAETDYPSAEFAKDAKEHTIWYVNGIAVKYITGSYIVPVHQGADFDTIIIQHTFYPYGTKPKKSKFPPDTARNIVLCKLRDKHNYKLRQILPGKFEIFSLDSFSARLAYRFSVINKTGEDTLMLFAPQLYFKKIFSDTVFQFIDGNEKLMQSFTANFQLTSRREIGCMRYIENPEGNRIYCNVSFLFLHGEVVDIRYDYSSGKYSIQIE